MSKPLNRHVAQSIALAVTVIVMPVVLMLAVSQETSAAPSIPMLLMPFDESLSINYTSGPHVPYDTTACAVKTMIYSSTVGGAQTGMNGIDFGFANGTEVLAVSAGRVEIYNDTSVYSSSGYEVRIIHNSSFATEYWHMSQVDLSLNGKSVSAGQVIGKSGYSGAYHLHLAFVEWNGSKWIPLSATGIVIDGYRIRGFQVVGSSTTALNYQGTLTTGSDSPQDYYYPFCGKTVRRWTGATTIQAQGGPVKSHNHRKDSNTTPPPATCTSSQYTASIYNNTSFSGTPVTQCHSQPLNKNWGAGSPAAGIGADNFTIRWTGQANVTAGTYDLYVRSDDGIRVWINNGLYIDRWDSPPYTGATFPVSTTAQAWNIKIEYIERGGNAYAEFRWSQRTTPPPVTCGSSQYTASIYNNTSFSGTPVTQCQNWPLNQNWGSGSPASGIGADNFTIRWTGRASFNAGKYDFYVRSDDGIRVWVNNALIINQWDNPPYTGMNYINYTMAAGTWDIKIEYIERSGNAYAEFRWTQQQTTGSPPAAPSNVQASNVSPGVVRVTWKDNSNNETGFRVWDGARYWTIGAASGSGGGWYTDLNGGWASGTYKCFQMQAYNDYGSSGWVGMSCLNTK